MRQVIPSGGQAMPSEGGCPRARAEGRVRMCDSGRVVSSHCLGFFSGSLCAHARLITAFNSRDALLSPSKELVSTSASKQCPGRKSAPSQAGRAPPGLWTPASACPEQSQLYPGPLFPLKAEEHSLKLWVILSLQLGPSVLLLLSGWGSARVESQLIPPSAQTA